MSTPHLTHNLDTPEKKERFLARLAQVVLEVEAAWPLAAAEGDPSGTGDPPQTAAGVSSARTRR